MLLDIPLINVVCSPQRSTLMMLMLMLLQLELLIVAVVLHYLVSTTDDTASCELSLLGFNGAESLMSTIVVLGVHLESQRMSCVRSPT